MAGRVCKGDFAVYVRVILPDMIRRAMRVLAVHRHSIVEIGRVPRWIVALDRSPDCGINMITYRLAALEARMAKPRPPDPKIEALRQRASLNPHPDRVSDPLFAGADFFDARDLVQVKYEMVRRVRVDRHPASRAAAAFGVSRPSFYQAQAALQTGGLGALVPKKPGPRRAHKLDGDVVDFLGRERSADPSVSSPELARRVRERFGRKVHPRSVERALTRREKKQP